MNLHFRGKALMHRKTRPLQRRQASATIEIVTITHDKRQLIRAPFSRLQLLSHAEKKLKCQCGEEGAALSFPKETSTLFMDQCCNIHPPYMRPVVALI